MDVTERTAAELATRESRDRFQALVETTSDVVWEMDRDALYSYVSPRVRDILGYEPEDLLGRPVFAILVDEDAERYATELATLAEHRRPIESIRNRVRHADGRILMMETSGRPFLCSTGEIGGYRGVDRDVTDRVRTEIDLEVMRNRLQLSLDAVDGGSWTWDVDSGRVEWDDRMREIFLAPGEISADFFESWMRIVHPEDREATATSMLESVERRENVDTEFRVATQRGWRNVWTRGVITERTFDGPLRVTGVCVDVTEQRSLERELELRNQDLETLLYIASHDLREPLRAIETFSRMVNDRYASLLDEKGSDFLQRIIRGAIRMDQLLSDLLTMSRMQRQAPEIQKVDGSKIVDRVVRMLEGKISESGATVSVEPVLPELTVDERWAASAIYNLVSNALKFTREGTSPEIEIGSWVGEVETGIVVRDRGPGVEPEHRERIFQLFQRAVPRSIEGTGAGLAIAKKAAERHGGRVWVQDREGGGSEFIITFGHVPSANGEDGVA